MVAKREKMSVVAGVQELQPAHIAGSKLAQRTANFVQRPHDVDGPASIVAQLIDLARDPGIDVVKIERLIDANERLMAIQARAAFNQAFAAMQGEIPVITETGEIVVEGQVRSRFARNADIQRVVKPIMQRHGFSLRFRHHAKDGILTVTGILAHAGGHHEEDQFDTGRDDSGKKNVIQSWGSARSYGQRYVTRALLNIASEAEDDDGETAVPRRTPPAPRRMTPAEVAGDDHVWVGDGDSSPSPADQQPAMVHAGAAISEKQLKRLHSIATNSRRSHEVLKAWLRARYGYASSKEIRLSHYDEIVAAIEAPGSLPLTSTTARSQR